MQTRRAGFQILRLLAGGFVLAALVLAAPTPARAQPYDLAFSTYLGGTDNEIPRDVAADPAGNIYVAGGTWSPDFPITHDYT